MKHIYFLRIILKIILILSKSFYTFDFFCCHLKLQRKHLSLLIFYVIIPYIFVYLPDVFVPELFRIYKKMC